MQCDPAFTRQLSCFHEAALENHHGVIYGVWADGKLGCVNAAWRRFAEENDGKCLLQNYTLGRSIYAAMSSEFQVFYKSGFRSCLASQKPWRHEYDCSCPKVLRHFQMVAYPLRREALLVVNSLLIEHLVHERVHHYVDSNGLVRQCWRCQRVARPGEMQQWDMIRSWAHSRLKVSHSLCTICLCYHFPEISRSIIDDLYQDSS
jgi:hypothetical protein